MPVKPNVVLITADNQPATLLGCYGNPDVETPHIDRMANEGMRFDWAFSTNGMCSPGRASIFTGLMPSTHGIHNWLDDEFLESWPPDWCAIREFRTFATDLVDSGYQTALIGKYHLGHPQAPMPGFQHWLAFATGHTVDFYDNEVFEDGRLKSVKDLHIVDYFADRAVEYLETVEGDTAPFFLNVNFDAPYLLPPSNLGPDPRNRFYERFVGRDFTSFPRTALGEGLLRRIDGPDDPTNYYRHNVFNYLRMHNDPATMANVCAQVAIVDEAVGRMLQVLRGRGLADNTLVIYTADQSNLYGQHGLWGHTMDTNPSHLYDAGLHIPLVVWRPGHVPAGVADARFVSQVDYAPTLASYLDIPDPDSYGPGRSFAPALSGGDPGEWEDVVFFEQEETRGIRTRDFAYWKRLPKFGVPAQLFDLRTDPDQEIDVIGEPSMSEVVGELDRRLTEFFDSVANPRYDLWQGGRPKGSLRKVREFQELYGEDWGPIWDVDDSQALKS